MTGSVNVISFGAIGDGITDDLPAFLAARDAMGAAGGVLTGPARKYRLGSTLDLSTQVALDFGCNANGGDAGGAMLFGTADAPVLRYLPGNRFVRLAGLSIVGNGCGPEQHGIHVANAGIWAENITIRGCGGHGLLATNTYCGSMRNLYVSLCGGDGIRLQSCAGANMWQHIVLARNGGDGIRIEGIDGADMFTSLVTEQNAGYGTRIEGNTRNCQAFGVFSEGNALGPIRFGPYSQENAWHFSSCGYSEPMHPDDYRGGSRNAWDGHREGAMLRHMFAGRVGIGLDAPSETLDVAGALAISGWRAMSYNDITLRLGADCNPGWSAVEVYAGGSRRAWW